MNSASASSPSPAFGAGSTKSSLEDRDRSRVLHYQQGNTEAFLTVVRNHQRKVFRLAHWLLRDEFAAERVTQAVFSRARRQFARGDCPASIAASLCYTSLRFSRFYHWRLKSPRVPLRSAFKNSVPPNPTNPLLDLKCFARVVSSETTRLEDRECELICLHQVIGLSVGGIARLLRTRPEEMRRQLTLALEKFQFALLPV